MQTMTPISELVAQAKMMTERNAAQFLHTFSFVPDDKLTWTPSETSKSALRIAAHIAVSNTGISKMIRNEDSDESMSGEQLMAMMKEMETSFTSREQVVAAVSESVATALAAIDTVNESTIGTSPMSPFGAFPMMFWMFLPANHMLGHAYQIDYLQTIWGDLEFHFVEM
jgi:hypothetical protein